MIFLVDLSASSHSDLFHRDLFPTLAGTFYVLVEGPASPARVERVKSVFPDLTLGTLKVVFVKSFAKSTIQKFAIDKCEDTIVDLRPTEWMLHTHLVPPSVSREVIRSTPFNPELRDVILKMILDTMCAIINGVSISPDEFPVLAQIQDKFAEFLDIDNECYENFEPHRHAIFCKPHEHVRTRTDPSGRFRWPVNTKHLELFRKAIDQVSFQDLTDLTDHEELLSVTYPSVSVSTDHTNEEEEDQQQLPVELREFVCTRTQSLGAFACVANCDASPEMEWVIDVTNGFGTSEQIDLVIETRTDPSAQIGTLYELFPNVSPGGYVYIKHPDMALTVMLSTWSTPVPLGSLHGPLAHVFENFSHFHASSNGSLWIQKRIVD